MEDVIYFKTQEELSDWLEEHQTGTSELWVGYFKKRTGRTSLTWSASVDAALCYGWIDGIRKTIDEQSYKIRFTPRKTNSAWSAVNINKVNALERLGKMKPAGMQLFNNRTDKCGYSSKTKNAPLSEQYKEQIRANQPAWLFFTKLAPSYKRNSSWWVMSAKKEETRLKRLGVLIESSEAGLKIPMLRKG